MSDAELDDSEGRRRGARAGRSAQVPDRLMTDGGQRWTPDNPVVIAANDSWYIKKFRGELISELVGAGWRVLAATGDEKHKADLRSIGADLVGLPIAPRSTSLFAVFNAARAAVAMIKRERPVAVYTFNPMTALVFSVASYVVSFRHVSTVSGLGAFKDIITGERKGPREFILRHALRMLLLKRPDVIITQNEADHQLCRRLRCKHRQTERVRGSGVDLARYATVERGYRPLRVLFASRLLVSKGVLDYVGAAKRLSHTDIQFTICGLPVSGPDGLSEADLLDVIRDTAIAYRGYVDDMATLLSTTDVVVLPSRYGEGIPRILIEGAASGCILVAYDQDGTRSIVADGQNGILLSQNHVDDLANAIAALRELSANDLAKMSRRSREMAEAEYAEADVIRTYVSTLGVSHQAMQLS